ncbi:85/ calcium-independent phospholipase A2 [Fulvia fulva]|uniref:85/ calcium-independent phospholipase A2 n=1 Tax=Passalora fulva TaxID=5499 RepID=A0A9Q8LG57_PASFU|nr:85/ calcium-independent phospholipase A2 [Fulvia fulva]KAK4626402.1 85/ calcium-independent phospholipase A2 [Fulvia fulva]KAK4628130.1 85/ calcium-independent phospholipase A2 [Fulvia fulva]UJO16013.1 85/ calcium-independent phospholipase A2 [Fulvia fulva]WPV13942.1 85/ calcium-independent phospholipase A2 [Fulvia fulva]WPV28047.1 85/ calcium-independent phospholipase A2 [Fulvia fulva]
MTSDARYREEDDDDSESPCEDDPSEECEDDRCNGPALPVWHCVDCDSSYCSDCWGRQGPHKPKKKGRDGVPHEKTDPHIVRRLQGILHPTKDAREIQRLHEDDGLTKWFGVARDLSGRPSFEDYGRYASLMSSISPIESMGNRYPQIVSFIGVTNAGKSTLIKMLVNHEMENASPEHRGMFPSPIVGSVVNDSLPTSGDVHLYADPSSHTEQLPILYADCEGFEGGERIPLGARSRKRQSSSTPEGMFSKTPNNVYRRPIEWANTEESRQREFAVTALYPRLLYTFSDCVVFVLRNPKTFQSAVLAKLLDWGASSLEKSINQPALPHCIVALNGSDPGVDDKEWDVNFATQSLLSSVRGALDIVEGVPRFRELAEYWRGLGKHIYSVEDLILRYYSSFKVIRIPSKPRYTTINEQVGKLQQTIKANCEESFRSKRRARMLTNADELNVYLQSGFDHFTQHLDIPFNFMRISLLRNPIPNDFGGHILQLCTTIMSQQPNHQHGRISWIFEKLSVMLASCVLLDCARYRKGRVDELFGNYEKFFDWAMGEYLEMHYPCSFISVDGTRQCMLVKARHQPKGHQDEKGIIAAGDYQAAFDASFLPQWKTQLRSSIATIQRDFQYELEQASHSEDMHAIPEERIALDLHGEYLNQFFEAVGPASSICSHATCFCCLMDVPEHPLACGHVLCTACIKAYGKQTKSTVSVACCPLHVESTRWAKPAVINFKPPGAGVRILALDGGGVRGIIQLEVLRAIEHALGGHLAVQSFFDLIVGSGTGGLIAVALAMKERTVDSCIDMFAALCEHAFTPRLKGVPIISQLAQVFGSGPKYKTKPLHAALKTAFTEDDELFSSTEKRWKGTRVGLTATSATGQETILLASYRRPEDLFPAYSFERPHDPDMELKTYQATAAAIASPNFFRPFTFHGKTYLDGGIRSPNPAFIADRERRLIWPDVEEPDMFLSLGTGQNRITILQKLSDRHPSNPGQIPEADPSAKKQPSKFRSRRGDDVLEAELAWASFRNYAVKEKSEARGRRYIRFNPDLDREPPSADSKSDMLSLQSNVRKRLQTAHRQAALRNVAHRLVASCFYLELQAKATAERSEQVCTGVLACRFEDGSPEMRALGRVIQDRKGDEFEPHFMVRPDQDRTEFAFKITITEDVIRAMIHNGVFGLPNVYIPLRNENKATSINLFLSEHDGLEPHGFPVSGFPRVLLGDASAQTSRRPGRTSSEQSLRNPIRRLKSSDGDAISLDGTSARGSIDDWQETDRKMSVLSTGTGKLSLADLISQHQQENSGTSIKQRTNRFWTYIGNNHMAQHPDMYAPEDLAKHGIARSSTGSRIDVTTPATDASSSSTSITTALPSLRSRHALPLSETQTWSELDSPELNGGTDKASQDSDHREFYSLAREHARSQVDLSQPPTPRLRDSHPTELQPQTYVPTGAGSNKRETTSTTTTGRGSTSRNEIPTMCETEFEEEVDDDWVSTYSGEDVQLQEAKASSLVQIPPFQFPPPANSNAHFGQRKTSLERGPLDHVVESSLPDENTATALDRWLSSQRSTTSLSRKHERLKVVQEEVEER